MTELKEITCDCSVANKCPEGKLGSERRCQIMISADKLEGFNVKPTIQRERDRLWCIAICTILSISDIARVTAEVNKLKEGGLS